MIGRIALLLMFLLGSAAAQDSTGPGVSAADAAAIRSVIMRQLDAFRQDDAAVAYAFAAPTIREAFPTPERFIGMVRQGYAPVYRSRNVEFSELARRDGRLVQEVELIGPDGRPALAVYTMVPDGAGSWLIAACELLPSVRLTT